MKINYIIIMSIEVVFYSKLLCYLYYHYYSQYYNCHMYARIFISHFTMSRITHLFDIFYLQIL